MIVSSQAFLRVTLVDEALDFLTTRVFAPDALARLGGEVTSPESGAADDHAAKANALEATIDDLRTAIDRQVLVFEKHDDPHHPVVVAAERRIEKLSAERKQLHRH